MPTAIPRAGAVRGVGPLHQRQPGAYSAQGVEALEASEVSDDELETKYQEAMALPTIVKQRRAGKPQSSGDKLGQKFPCLRWRQMGHWKDGNHCLAKVKRVNWAGGSSKLVGELGTVDCVSGSRHWVSLKPLFRAGRFGVCCGSVFLCPELERLVVSDVGHAPSQWDAGLCTRGRRYLANVLLSARRYYVGNPACL